MPENKSHNLTSSSPQLRFVYNFNEIECNLSVLFWDYVSASWYFSCIVPTFLMMSCACVFLLTQIVVKTISKTIHEFCTKSCDYYFLRFHDDSKNMFLSRSNGNYFFSFQITFPRYVHIGRNFQGTLKLSILSILNPILNLFKFC